MNPFVLALLNLNLSSTLSLWISIGVVTALVVALITLRSSRPRLSRTLWSLGGLIIGAFLGSVVVWYITIEQNTFGQPLEPQAEAWAVAAFALWSFSIVCGLFLTRWRKLVALPTLVAIFVMSGIGINGTYGLTPTLADLLHISTQPTLDLPARSSSAQIADLGAKWVPPADMPSHGVTGIISGGIPNSVSGFAARPATIYLPPAALVKNPPQLPFMVFMMGEPGDPDPRYIASALNAYASVNHGLAPIVVVADQLGAPTSDPLCINSNLGNVEDYVMKDVVNWATSHLNIETNRTMWTIAGFSNGGGCAAYLGAKYPSVWGNILSVTGVEYAGAGNESQVLHDVFQGNQVAYDAIKPGSLVASQHYEDTVAVFTAAGNDKKYGPGQQRLSLQASQAGMNVYFDSLENVGHTRDSLKKGLKWGVGILYPRWGLTVKATP